MDEALNKIRSKNMSTLLENKSFSTLFGRFDLVSGERV